MPNDNLWDRRIRRAETLATSWPYAGDVLRFFKALTVFQKGVGTGFPPASLGTGASTKTGSGPGDVGPEAVPPGSLSSLPPALIDLLRREAPPDLRRAAETLGSRTPEEWGKILAAAWTRREGGAEEPPAAFFPRALLQPWAAVQSLRWRKENPEAGDGGETCPFCGRLPVVSVLREDKLAEAVARSLVCSLCSLEWGYTRVLCPGCREEKPERLPRLAAAEIPWIRVEACDACGRYLKAVDLTREPAADPVTDEIGSTPLDVVALERGYAKLQTNIVGV